MKKFITILILSFMITSNTNAQVPYTTTTDDNKVVILNGIISKKELKDNPAFSWYAGNQSGYTPAPEVLTAMQAAKDKFQFLIFGGTWCGDTQNIIPKFFKLQELSGVADKDISFFAVDRQKQTFGNLSATFKITNVPTIIVMKDGKEVGRVVEYGKTGNWDKEVAELLK